MKKVNKKFMASLLCLATLSPVLYACSCSKEEQTQNVEYTITKGNAPHGTYTLEYDNETKKVKVISIPDEGYEFSRAYYVYKDNPSVEYAIEEDGFTKPNANITVYVVFTLIPEQPPIIEAQLNIQQSNHGTISVNDNTPDAGDTVNLTLTPDEGYFVSRLYYTRYDGSDVEINNKTFTMIDEPITVKAEFTKFYGTYELVSSTIAPTVNLLSISINDKLFLLSSNKVFSSG